MIIRYFAILREITHKSEEVLVESVPTVRVLLERLCVAYGPELRRWIEDANGELGGISVILVNGNDYRHLNGLDTPLAAGDMVSIFPPVAGG